MQDHVEDEGVGEEEAVGEAGVVEEAVGEVQEAAAERLNEQEAVELDAETAKQEQEAAV